MLARSSRLRSFLAVFFWALRAAFSGSSTWPFFALSCVPSPSLEGSLPAFFFVRSASRAAAICSSWIRSCRRTS